MTSPAASVVVPSRGGAGRLPVLLKALGSQTSSNFEVVVVLDGDIDGSAAVVDAAAKTGLPVRAVVFEENKGRSAALNAGFAAARGRVLIRCDDDLVPGPGYVAGHVARHAGAAGETGATTETGDAAVDSAGATSSTDIRAATETGAAHAGSAPVGVIGLTRNVFQPSAYARAYGRARDVRFRDDAYRVPAEARWRFWAANVSVTRETYDSVGDYDTGFRAYGWEDVDWGYRLHQAGVPVVLASELETPHLGTPRSTAARVQKAFDSGAARQRFVAKHGEDMFSTESAAGVWGGLVRGVSTVAGRRGLVIASHVADGIADYLPTYVAEKLISLLVEAAALSGRRRTGEVTTDI